MSIPKEPRQLMINLMYLVLTAMLALNVSAEIINAFFMLDHGIERNNHIVEHGIHTVITGMEETANTKVQYKPLVTAANEATKITEGFLSYIDEMRERMVEESGGKYTKEDAIAQGHPELEGKPLGKKDKDTPQRIFVSGDYGSEGKKQPQGEILEVKILELKEKYLDFVASLWDNGGIPGTIFAKDTLKEGKLKELEEELTLTSSENYKPGNHDDKSWAAYTFGHMPVAAIYPMLRKFQNDASTSEAAVVNFLAEQMGKLELNYDKFAVFSQSPKPYILQGEQFETEIALGAFSSQADFKVFVGGRELKIEDGKAKYTTRPSGIGEKKYVATIEVINPLTGDVMKMEETFHYEVGAASVNVSADKMNVFYIGVDNPVTVAAAGIPTSAQKTSISGSGGKLQKKSTSEFIVTATKQGTAIITVTDTKKNKKYTKEFRVKRIPNPTVYLAGKTDGLIKSGTFKAQLGLIPKLENFDFDARCNIQSYTMYYTPKRQDPIPIEGKGNRFTGKVLKAIRSAKPGAQFAFSKVKARCPGDTAGRQVNGLAFQIR
jgi:hypothetical protein